MSTGIPANPNGWPHCPLEPGLTLKRAGRNFSSTYGALHGLLIGRANQAINLLKRAAPGDRAEARRLLNLALSEARQMKLPGEVETIESWLTGLDD
jgi:hypothetical protein